MPIEILAPAGDLNCAVAAIESGANAVYVGLPGFNARARANDFTLEDLGRLCSYAHKQGAKVYVAVNTLVKESELAALFTVLVKVIPFNIDAFILQDFGVLWLFRHYFPKATLHASTQMGFHNLQGLKTAKQLGFSRVILERQVTFNELSLIMKGTPLEVEIFVHGALCISLSGTCLMSSLESGCSGNRGRCKQPCRRRFTQGDQDGFFLSPTDLSLLDHIKIFEKLGVTSLKIEGRMRKSDHVMSIVKTVVAARDQGKKEANELLKKVYGRETSEGFFLNDQFKTLIKTKSVGAQGLLIGKVIFQQQNIVRIKCMSPIQRGDRIRIQSEDGNKGVAITLIEYWSKKDEIEFLCKEHIKVGSGVYRIGESLPAFERLTQQLPPFKYSINIKINIDATSCKIDFLGTHFEKQLCLQKAEKHALHSQKVQEAFSIVPHAEICAGKIEVEIDGDYFMSAGDLKQLRQIFWQFAEKVYNDKKELDQSILLGKFAFDYHEKESLQKTCNPLALNPQNDFFSPHPSLFKILPFFIPENEEVQVKNRLIELHNCGVKIFGITRIEHIDLLRSLFALEDLTLIALPPMPITNSFSTQLLVDLSVTSACAHLELSKHDLEALLNKTQLPLYQYVNGYPVLMSTRAQFAKKESLQLGSFNWRVWSKFPFDLIGLINSHAMKTTPITGYNLLTDERFGALKGENSFNFERIWE